MEHYRTVTSKPQQAYPNPSSQQSPPSQTESQPAAQPDPFMMTMMELLKDTKAIAETTNAKVDKTNADITVKIDETNAKVDKTSAEIATLRHDISEEVTQVKEQVASVIEDVDKIKGNIDTIRKDSKKTEERIIQYVNDQLHEKLAELTASKVGLEVVQEQQKKTIPEVMVVAEVSSPTSTQEQLGQGYSQPLPTEVEAYLKESSEDKKVLESIQWLFNQVKTDINLVLNGALDPIRAASQPRCHIMQAMQSYQDQKDSLQGRKEWAASKAATTKQGAQAIQELMKAMQPIAVISSDKTLPKDIQRAATSLVSHLHALEVTYNKVTNENTDTITKETNGTMVVPKRELTAMMATVPDFSGEEEKGMASWLDFYIAVSVSIQTHKASKM